MAISEKRGGLMLPKGRGAPENLVKGEVSKLRLKR